MRSLKIAIFISLLIAVSNGCSLQTPFETKKIQEVISDMDEPGETSDKYRAPFTPWPKSLH